MPSREISSLANIEASRMFSLWMCLSLFVVLRSSVSSDQVVKLNCSSTGEVGQNVKLTCLINWSPENCRGLSYFWHNTENTNLCNSGLRNYICEWDPQRNVSLTILNSQKKENVTVEIESDCGMAKSDPISVPHKGTIVKSWTLKRQVKEKSHMSTTQANAMLCVFVTVVVVAVFSV